MKQNVKRNGKIVAMAVVAALGMGVLMPATGVYAASQEYVNNYNAAAASIEKVNKLDALKLAIAAVNEQLPEGVAYWDMWFGSVEVTGHACGTADYRNIYGAGCPGGGVWAWVALEVAVAEGLVDASVLESDNALKEIPAQYEDKTLRELLNIGEANAKYKTDAEFKKVLDNAETMYVRGVASLRKGLAIVNPDLKGLADMSGDELVAAYENLPEVKEDKYKLFREFYSYALMVVDRYNEMSEKAVAAYADLVAAAKVFDPMFAVDLSGLAVKEEAPALPKTPNTGETGRGEGSAEIVKVAIAGVVVAVAGTGAVLTAKRYLFSPLKRRK